MLSLGPDPGCFQAFIPPFLMPFFQDFCKVFVKVLRLRIVALHHLPKFVNDVL